MSYEVPIEESRSNVVTGRYVFPKVVHTLLLNLFASGDQLFNGSAKMGDNFSGVSYFDWSDFSGTTWTLISTSATAELATALAAGADTLTQDQNLFFNLVLNLETLQRLELTKAGWRTRKTDRLSQFQLSAASFVGTFFASLALGMLKSKTRTWGAQIQLEEDTENSVMKWRKIEYSQINPMTWQSYLYGSAYGHITGDDLSRIKEVLTRWTDYDLAFPKESYEIVDKFFCGSIPLKYWDIEAKLEVQDVDWLMLDPSMSTDPVETNTEDTYLRYCLQNLTVFFKMLFSYAKDAAYPDSAEAFKMFIDTYKPEPLTTTWLLTWGKLKYPWQYYMLRTHKDGVSSQYEFITVDYESSPNDLTFNTGSIFNRFSSDDTDEGLYFKYWILPGYTDDEVRTAIIFGYHFMGSFAETGLAYDGDFEFDYDFDDQMVVFKAVESYNQEGSLVRYIADAATPVILGDDLTEDQFYSYFNPTDNGLWDNMFAVQVYELATETTNGLVTIGASETERDQAYYLWMTKRFVRKHLAVEYINRAWTRPYILAIFNPFIAPEQKQEPPKTSKLTPASYDNSDNKDELTKLVKDTETRIQHLKETGAEAAVPKEENFKTKVEDQIKKVTEEKKKEEVQQSDDTSSDRDGGET
jgi:hypothetical protein